MADQETTVTVETEQPEPQPQAEQPEVNVTIEQPSLESGSDRPSKSEERALQLLQAAQQAQADTINQMVNQWQAMTADLRALMDELRTALTAMHQSISTVEANQTEIMERSEAAIAAIPEVAELIRGE